MLVQYTFPSGYEFLIEDASALARMIEVLQTLKTDIVHIAVDAGGSVRAHTHKPEYLSGRWSSAGCVLEWRRGGNTVDMMIAKGSCHQVRVLALKRMLRETLGLEPFTAHWDENSLITKPLACEVPPIKVIPDDSDWKYKYECLQSDLRREYNRNRASFPSSLMQYL